MSENLSILVVDDYPPIANTLADILDRKGFEVKTANSGAEPWRSCEIIQWISC